MSAKVRGLSLLPFGDLVPHTPRRFVPGSLDLGSWDALGPWVDRLEARRREATWLAEFDARLAGYQTQLAEVTATTEGAGNA